MRVRHLLAVVSLSVVGGTTGGTTALADPPGLFGVGEPPVTMAPAAPRAVRHRARARAAAGGAALGVVASGVVVQGGNHPGFGRLTFDFPTSVDVTAVQEGEAVTLHFNAAHFDAAEAVGSNTVMMPRNVRRLSGDAQTVTVAVAPGARMRSSKSGNQVVLDILDPTASVAGAQLLPPKPATVQPGAPGVAAAVDDAANAASLGRVGTSSVEASPALPASRAPATEPTREVTAEALPAPQTPAAASDPAPTDVAGAAMDPGGSDLGASERPTAPSARPDVGPKPVTDAAAKPSAAPLGQPAVPASAPGAGSPRPAAVTAPAVAVPTVPSSVPAQGPAPVPVAPIPVAPVPIAAPAPVAAPASAPPPAETSAPVTAESGPAVAPSDAPAAPFSTPVGPVATPGWSAPIPSGSEPVRLSAKRIAVATGSKGAAISLPFASSTGAAALRRGDSAIVVFDEKRPVDLAALQGDPVFGSAAVQLQEGATVLRLRLPAGSDLRLAQVASGWTLWVGPVGDPMDTALQSLPSNVAGQRMVFTAMQASKVVVVADLETGRNLLIGTQRRAGQGVPVARQTPDFILLPSLQGVAVEPTSDKPELRVGEPGFVLTGGSSGLALSSTVGGDAVAEAATLSRRFDLPALPLPMLKIRLQSRFDEAAATPKLARLQARRAVAEAMLALGLGQEAEGELRLAVIDDPRGASDPDMLAMGAMAAVLSHRPLAAAAIDDPRLTGTDEMKLWRALRRAQLQEGAPDAAADLAATTPLVLAYPETLRDKLLPLVAETEALGGQLAAAASLLEKRHDDPKLSLARAMLAQAKGDNAAALAGYDAVAQEPDRLQRYRASLAAIQLRLSTGAMTAAQAADAGEKLFYAWRGDERERNLRVQVADWRGKAGQWRAALAMLRESAAMYPDEKPAWRQRMKQALDAMLHDDRIDGMNSFDLVSVLGENADLLPDGADGEAASARLADRLQMLDLDQRAAPVLDRLARTAPTPAARGSFGERLAELKLEAGDPAGALAALAASASDGLNPGLAERRALLAARADAAAGRGAQAVAELAALGTPGADALRASLLEQAKDWPAAASALASLVTATVPPTGALTPEQSRLVLRLAAALAQAGDESGLAGLQTLDAARMANTADGPAFKLLTQTPVRTVTDLPRAGREMTAARAVARSVK